MIVPPSVVMILYAILTENSIITLFLAAVVPGLLAVVFYFVAIAIVVRLYPETAPRGDKLTWPERRRETRNSWAILSSTRATCRATRPPNSRLRGARWRPRRAIRRRSRRPPRPLSHLREHHTPTTLQRSQPRDPRIRHSAARRIDDP